MKILKSTQGIQTEELQNLKKTSDLTIHNASIINSFFESQDYNNQLLSEDDLRIFSNFCLGFTFEDSDPSLIPSLSTFFLRAWDYLKGEGNRLFSAAMPSDALHEAAQDLAQGSSPVLQNQDIFISHLKSLDVGKSLSLATGREEEMKGYHSIILRIVKTGEKIFDLYLYDGNGNESVLAERDAQTSLSYPCIRFKNITEEELFLQVSPESAPSLLLFKKFLNWEKNPAIEHIAQSFFPIYHKMLMPEDSSFGIALKTHNFKNLPVKTFRCLILEQLKNKEDYKRFDLDLRLFALLDLFGKWRNFPNETMALALKEATTRFVTLIDQHRDKFSEETYIKACATSEEILREVNGFLKLQKTAKELQPKSPQWVKDAKSRKDYLKDFPLPGNPILNLSLSSSWPLINANLGESCSWKDLRNTLQKACSQMQNLPGLSSQAQFEILMNHLRSLKNQSIAFDSYEDANATLKDLNACLDLYLKTLHSLRAQKPSHTHSAKEQNAVMETLAIGYLLAKEADRLRTVGNEPNALSYYGIDYSLYESLSQSSLFHIADKNTLEHRNELLEFFSSHSEKKQLFQFISKKDLKVFDITQGIYPEARYHLDTQADIAPLKGEKAEKFLRLCDQVSPDQNNEFSHFFSLKALALKATDCFLADTSPRKASDKDFYISSFLQSCYMKTENVPIALSYHGRFSSWNFSNLGQDKTWKRHFSATVQQYKSSPLSSHFSADIPSENKRKTLRHADKLPSWANALCVPGAQTSVLLQEMARNLHNTSLEELSALRLFLYKTVDKEEASSEKQTTSPLIDHLIRDPNFLKRLRVIGEEAYLVWHNEPIKERHLRFILQLEAELLQLYKETHSLEAIPADFSTLIDAQLIWLKERGGSKEPQERFSYLLAETSLLMALPLDTLSNQKKAALFLSLMSLYQHAELFFSDLSFEATTFLHLIARAPALQKLWLDVQKNEDQLLSLSEAILHTLQPGLGVSQVELDGDLIRVQDHDGGVWEIDCMQYTLFTPSGPFGKAIESRALRGLTRLHLHTIPSAHEQSGAHFSFKDRIWGDVRVNNQDVKDSLLERRFENNVWYTYISPSHISSSLRLNAALIYDHAVWVTPSSGHLIITDLNGNSLYETNESGELVSLHKETLELDEYNAALSRFEDPAQICSWKDPSGKVRYHLPRYDSSEPLFSLTKQGAVRYEKNPTFYVDQDHDQPDWGVDKFLNLKTENGEQRLVLIPHGQVSSDPLSSYCSLTLSDVNADGNKGSQTYFEYDIKNGALAPKSLNGRLHLIHLLLGQKKYAEALDLIQGISMSDIPDKKTWKLLFSLLKSATSNPSPKANAVRLHAYLRLYELKPNAKKFQNEKFLTAVGLSYSMYLRSPNIQEAGFALAPSEETIFTHLKKEALGSLLFAAFCESFKQNLPSERAREKFRELVGERIYNLIERAIYWTGEKIKARIQKCLYSNQKILPLPLIGQKLQDFVITIIAPFRNIYQQEIHRHALLHKGSITRERFTHTLKPSVSIHPRQAYKELKLDSDLLNYIDGHVSLEYKAGYENRIGAELKDVLLQEKFRSLYATLAQTTDHLALLQWTYKVLHDDELTNELPPLARWILLLVIHQKMQKKKVKNLAEISHGNLPLIQWVHQLAGKKPFVLKTLIQRLPCFKQNLGAIEVEYPKAISKELSEPLKTQKIAAPAPVSALLYHDPLHPLRLDAQEIQDEEPSWEAYLQEPAPAAAIETETSAIAAAVDPKKAHVQRYKKDQEIAKQIAATEPRLKKDISRDVIESDLNIKIQSCKNEEALLEERIKALLERPFAHTATALHQYVRTEVRGIKPASIEDVCRAATHLTDAHQNLSALNPALTKEELIQLKKDALQLMVLQTRRNHFTHILSEMGKKCSNKELAALLSSKRQYKANEDPFYLFFEWISGMRIREKQMHILIKARESIMKGESFVFQLIMAGGKSSVIFSILLEVISNCTNKVPCVVAHHSQYAATLSNLKEFQKNRFNKDLITLDATLEDLNDPVVVRGLLHRFDKAKKKGCPLVMRSSFPQVLKIKLMTASINATDGKEIPEHLSLLCELIGRMEKEGLFVFDEIDASLSMRVDVRTSFGAKKTFPGDEIDTMRSLYDTLATVPVIQTAVATRDKIDSETYRTKILPHLAQHLFSHFKFEDKHKPAFIRFMIKEEKLAEHAAEDAAFFELIKQGLSATGQARRQIELFASARHIINDILPSALSRPYFQKFGPKLGIDEGEVVPYVATGVPATTKFGNPYVALCLHLQAALSQNISKDEILFLGKKMLEDAEVQAGIEQTTINNTLEGKQFERMAGITLRDIEAIVRNQSEEEVALAMQKSEVLEKAFQHVNTTSAAKLKFRSETTAYHVPLHAQEIYANAIDLAVMTDIVNGGTGTPNNYPSYNIELGTPDLEKGTEGKVLNRMLEDNLLAGIQDKSLDGLINFWQQLDEEGKKQLSGLIDTGGYLKSEPSMNDAAKKLQTFFKTHPEFGKKAIVYLHKFEGKEAFVLLRNNATSPLILKDTSKAEFEKHKIDLNHIFFVWDELRSRGTDFPLPGTKEKPALFFATFDPNMLLSNSLQGYMRCRGYLGKRQKICGIVATADKPLYHKEADCLQSVLKTFVKTEAATIGEETLHSYLEQFFAIIREHALRQVKIAIIKGNFKQLCQLVATYKEFIINEKHDFNYESWLGDTQNLDTMTILSNAYKKILEKDPEMMAKRKKILDHAAENPYLPKTITGADTSSLFQEVLIENVFEVHNTVETKALEELENELQRQLEIFQLKNGVKERKEMDWTSSWKQGSLPPSSETLADFLKKPIPGLATTESFASFFPDNLHITDNLKSPFADAISAFDRRFKSSEFALFVQTADKKLHAVLLSKQEKEFVQNYLRTRPRENAWLFNLQGTEEEHFNGKKFPKDLKQEKQNLLWQANFFNGNADYLNQNKHRPLTEKLAIEKKNPLLGQYLLFKNAKNRTQLLHTLRTGLVSAKALQCFENKPMCSDRRHLLEKVEGQAYNIEALANTPQVALNVFQRALKKISSFVSGIGSMGATALRIVKAVPSFVRRIRGR